MRIFEILRLKSLKTKEIDESRKFMVSCLKMDFCGKHNKELGKQNDLMEAKGNNGAKNTLNHST